MTGECELYVVPEGYQCGNCGYVMGGVADGCQGCGSNVVGVVDEGYGDAADETPRFEDRENRRNGNNE